MFDNIDMKIKGDALIVSAVGVLGKEKLCEIPLNKVKDIKWSKESKVTLINLLIKKGHTDIAVTIDGKKK